MYTVVRFTSDSVAREVFEHIGTNLNELIPGAYTGFRHAGDGFACEISGADTWQDHQVAICNFIRMGKSVIATARQEDVCVCIDVAVEPEDFEGTSIFGIYAGQELVKLLAETGVDIEISIYKGGTDTEEGDGAGGGKG